MVDAGVKTDRAMMNRRTKRFALAMMELAECLPRSYAGRAIAAQMVRCATSVGANYRASGRARSTAEFVAKLGIVVEEADECCYWLELIAESGMLQADRTVELHREADELLRILVAAHRSAKARSRKA